MRRLAAGAGVLIIGALAMACGGGRTGGTRSSGDSAQANGAASPPVAAANEGATSAAGKPICPANGLWAACSVLQRLDQAGLAPRRDSSAAREAPLGIPGILFRLGSAELAVFIYADSASRQRDESRLDRSKFITPAQQPSLAGERTLIESANLLGILSTRNDHQRERVADAITAGPPQKSGER